MIQAIIIEDEEIAATRLQELITDITPNIEIIKTLSSVKQAVNYIPSHTVDLLFLDINLSDGHSFEIFEQIKVTTPIIFTTAYSSYAIQAFEQNSISYLLKPITKVNLQKAIDKFYGLNQNTINYQDLKELLEKPEYKSRFLIKLNNTLQIISISQIAYFYTEDKVTFLKTHTAERYPLEYSLKQLEQLLDPKTFFRINKKYMVRATSIYKMYYASKSKIKLELQPNMGDNHIFVALEKIGKFKKWLSV